MISKNLSISTENLTPILRCKIVLRLRFVICILISFICILSGQNDCFSQGLVQKVQDDLYISADLSSVIKPGQAFILYDYAPSGAVSNTTIWTYSQIKSGKSDIDWTSYTSGLSFGRMKLDRVADKAYVVGIIDDTYYYVRAPNSTFFDNGLPSLNDQLSLAGLGSPEKRFAYISSLDVNNSLITVTPYDFRSNLQPWIVSGLVIAILIPAWHLMRRFLRG